MPATAATREVCAPRRASSVARYCSRERAFRLRMRPKRSSSHEAMPRPTVYDDLVLAVPFSPRLSGTRYLSPVARTPIVGKSSERWIR